MMIPPIIVFALVALLQNTEAAPECKLTKQGTDYRGTKSVTVSFRECQAWTQQTPHKYNATGYNFPDGKECDARDYCRNPDNKPEGPWCYTLDPETPWEYCDIPTCECKSTKQGTEYAGTKAVTKTGLKCQAWADQCPHKHNMTKAAGVNFLDGNETEAKNYCRNPNGSPEGPWCFTTDPGQRWEYCDVLFCDIGQCAAETNPCKDDGVCVNTNDGYSCICAPGFEGKNCTGGKFTCPTGWLIYEKSCYRRFTDQPGKTFDQAISYCKSIGAEVPLIHTTDERDFVFRNVSNKSWFYLGAKKGSPEIDAKLFQFRNAAYPCLIVENDGLFRDWGCDSQPSAVCRKKATPA